MSFGEIFLKTKMQRCCLVGRRFIDATSFAEIFLEKNAEMLLPEVAALTQRHLARFIKHIN